LTSSNLAYWLGHIAAAAAAASQAFISSQLASSATTSHNTACTELLKDIRTQHSCHLHTKHASTATRNTRCHDQLAPTVPSAITGRPPVIMQHHPLLLLVCCSVPLSAAVLLVTALVVYLAGVGAFAPVVGRPAATLKES
jgi:hypothetical protein